MLIAIDVAKVTSLDSFEGLERFFEGFLIERGVNGKSRDRTEGLRKTRL